ncbi:MAG: hypothetical protein CM15mV45_430 [uncultured marine virus]|nr:MAG: hypothetical protein CM15mV45_430 [uncultured marine virus]
MSEEGGGFSKQEAFNRVLPEFRKKKDPEDSARETRNDAIIDIILNLHKIDLVFLL